jgi:hypothetical protein
LAPSLSTSQSGIHVQSAGNAGATSAPLAARVATTHAAPASKHRTAVVVEEPSIVIADAEEFGDDVERALRGDEHAKAALVRAGVAAMPALMARFPGKLEAQLAESGAPPSVATLSRAAGLVLAMGRVAHAYLASAAEDADVTTRLVATLAGSELNFDVTVPALRLAQDDSNEIRNAALYMLRRACARDARYVVECALRIAGDVNHPPPRRILVLDAIGALREAVAVPMLVPVLADSFAQVALAAGRALTRLTGQDFARDGRKWTAWWTTNVGRHRAEWLIDALLNEDNVAAAKVAEELEIVIQVRLPDDFLATHAGRERLFGELRSWWQREGRAKIAGQG